MTSVRSIATQSSRAWAGERINIFDPESSCSAEDSRISIALRRPGDLIAECVFSDGHKTGGKHAWGFERRARRRVAMAGQGRRIVAHIDNVSLTRRGGLTLLNGKATVQHRGPATRMIRAIPQL